MDIGTLEQWLWDAACEIRGPLDAPKFKDYILPLVFLKRLSDVFADEVARLAGEFGSEEAAAKLVCRYGSCGMGPSGGRFVGGLLWWLRLLDAATVGS